jgi:mannose-1-phosphate guanylyltransferase
MNNRYAIIMAGGVGSRFWPLSRSEKPKQFLDVLGNGETLLQQTFRRFKSICPAENIFVVTNSEHKVIVQDQLEIRHDRILSEPARRNTAPCIAYGTYVIIRENPDALIVVTPADHLIEKEDEFRNIIIRGFEFARENNVLLTLGIRPDKPETGYGYIQADKVNPVKGFNDLFKVNEFTEKPDKSKAVRFIESGNYFWNAGIFIWSQTSILTALMNFLPDINSVFSEGKSYLGTMQEDDFIGKIYPTLPSISIDFGVLEKADNVYVLGSDIGWSDLGTWSSLYDHSDKDENENALISGRSYSHHSSGNIVSIPEGKVILFEGLKDYIIVDTKDALLIIRKEEEQKIKEYLGEINLNIKNQVSD